MRLVTKINVKRREGIKMPEVNEDKTKPGKFPGVKPKPDELEPETVPMFGEDPGSIREG